MNLQLIFYIQNPPFYRPLTTMTPILPVSGTGYPLLKNRVQVSVHSPQLTLTGLSTFV